MFEILAVSKWRSSDENPSEITLGLDFPLQPTKKWHLRSATDNRTMLTLFLSLLLLVCANLMTTSDAFAQITQAAATKAVNIVTKKLKADRSCKTELGKLVKVNAVLGYGSPKENVIAVRFECSFNKPGVKSGQDRGIMRGQVKASVAEDTGKVVSCSVFRDLGWGRTWDMKI